jgi:putative transposase
MWTGQDRERHQDDGRRYPSDLSETEWALIRPLVETYPTLTRDLREMVNGCLYLAAEGCRWRALPKEFGPSRSDPPAGCRRSRQGRPCAAAGTASIVTG